MCDVFHPDPLQVPELQSQFHPNDGLPSGRITELAKPLGFEDAAPMAPSPGGLAIIKKKVGLSPADLASNLLHFP